MITILIVDDSEIDRMVLKNILTSYYNVIEAENGYAALEVLNNPTMHIDGLLLDISMPGLDGFSVLNLLDKSRHAGMQIMFISAEVQKGNIIKAANYGAAGFFKKPYDSDQILGKLKQLFAQKNSSSAFNPSAAISDSELRATAIYAERLRRVYLTYLKSVKKDDSLYIHVSEIVHLMLESYFTSKNPRDLTPEGIEIISQAAYFYDIGMSVVRQEKFKVYQISDLDDIPDTHTIAGADLVSINNSPSVAYFVKICSDICMHHHERYDGRGMPHGLKNSINNIYTQMCSISIDFCKSFFTVEKPGYQQFNLAINTLLDDREAFRPDVFELLQNCQEDIVNHYSR